MYAVIKTGGKQYRVAANDKIQIEKLEGKPGDRIEFAEVLMVSNGESVDIGAPFISGATVVGGVPVDPEPVYVWANTGTGNYTNPGIGDYSPNECGATAPSAVGYIVKDRDFFLNVAKPGYVPYGYPHPLASGTGPPPTATVPAAPTGLTAQ